MALKPYEAFTAPSPYDQERMRAERLRRYAELLQQQSMEPEGEFTYQGFRAMPSPAAALGKMLQAYNAKKFDEKAEEAQKKAQEADIAQLEELQRDLGPQTRVASPDMFADPMQMESKYTPPVTEAIMPTAQEREGRLAKAFAGGSPAAQRYAQLMMSRTPQVSVEALMEASPESRQKFQETGDYTVLEKPAKAAEYPSDVQSYQFYVNQETTAGRTPKSFEQFKASQRANAPSTVVNLDTKGSQLGQELFLKKIDQLSGPANNASRIVNQVAAMEDATKKSTFTGALAPNAIGAAQFLSSFGIDVKPETLANSRTFQAASNQLVLDFMAANGGARGFTEKETAILQDAFPKIVDSPQARTQIASLLRRRSKQDVADYNKSVETYRRTYPNSVIPYEPIQDADSRYEEWKRSQGLQ